MNNLDRPWLCFDRLLRNNEVPKRWNSEWNANKERYLYALISHMTMSAFQLTHPNVYDRYGCTHVHVRAVDTQGCVGSERTPSDVHSIIA